MTANPSNALFAIDAAESSNSFWRKINVICQNRCLKTFKHAGLVQELRVAPITNQRFKFTVTWYNR